MGRRTWIDSDIWYDIRKLNPTEQSLYLHLLINECGNIAGYYKLNIRHLAVDMQMFEDEVLEILKRDNKYWRFDEETEQVLLPKYTKYNMVKGAPQIKKLNAELSSLTPCKLHGEFMKAWEECNGIGSAELIQDHFKRWA